ncbi:MAG TPA: hypothetical protein VHD84_01860, partial [Candidatus Saccharimonadales bacterium]|nr:hypothetical protein [Candidatus Saccharimonadales bacterium]
WEDNLEYQLLDIPRPDINFFLRVPVNVSKRLMEERNAKTGAKPDEHEKNAAFLKRSLATYDLLCQLFPKDFSALDCTRDGRLLSVPEINNLIWERIKPLLPADKPHPGHSAVVTLSSSPESKAKKTDDPDGKLVQHFKNASLFLKLNIERYTRSVEPAGLGIWSDYDYKFYTPAGMPREIEAAYKASMERIASLHGQMRQKLQSYYERHLLNAEQKTMPNISELLIPVTPLAALCDFSATLSHKRLSRIAATLLANDSEELQWTAKQLYVAARQKWPESFKQPLESASNPEPVNNIMAKLAEDRLTLNSGDKDDVKLIEAAPRQEFSLLAASIYPYSSLSLDEISEEVSGWSYQQKYESLTQAAQDQSVMEKVQYKLDLISDQATMSDIISRVAPRDVQAQQPSPRFGYEVPAAIEDAGIDELYLECFDESLKLFSILQQADREDLTVYAALVGHKLRWQFSANAARLSRLFTSGGNHNPLVVSIHEVISEVHPLIWEVLNGSTASAAAPKPKKNRVKPSRRRSPRRRGGSSKKS